MRVASGEACIIFETCEVDDTIRSVGEGEVVVDVYLTWDQVQIDNSIDSLIFSIMVKSNIRLSSCL